MNFLHNFLEKYNFFINYWILNNFLLIFKKKFLIHLLKNRKRLHYKALTYKSQYHQHNTIKYIHIKEWKNKIKIYRSFRLSFITVHFVKKNSIRAYIQQTTTTIFFSMPRLKQQQQQATMNRAIKTQRLW